MKKRICYLISVSVLILLNACSPMDYKYKEFTEDGPITYLAKLNVAEVKVIGERNRVRFILPKLADPRTTQAIVYWSNKKGKHTEPVNPSQETSFYINDLPEASYIFEISLLDNEGNTSIPVMLTATVYGKTWESYLPNRIITENVQVGNDRKISYQQNTDKRMIGTDIEWKQDGVATPFTASFDSSMNTGMLENFRAASFRYRTRYVPEKGGSDVFYSPWEYYITNVDVKDVEFDKATTTFTMPEINDGNWAGYEFFWTDKTTGELKMQSTASKTITLQNYNSLSVNYRTLYKFDDVPISSVEKNFSTVRYVDLDRSSWYAAPETRLSDGTPLKNVTEAQVVDKAKSTYLSHPLFYASSGTDGKNFPGAHFDNDESTYLAMVKGYGTGLETNRNLTGTKHSIGGVASDGNDIYFIIDLGAQKAFNYFRIVYRSAQSNGNLKPQMVSFFGSNDPECITNPDKWSVIQESVVPPGCTEPSNNTNVNHVGRVTGNVILPDVAYRYFKLRYDGWTDGSQTMAIAEFFLGLYN